MVTGRNWFDICRNREKHNFRRGQTESVTIAINGFTGTQFKI